jgi:LPS export ABC transporter permease LptF
MRTEAARPPRSPAPAFHLRSFVPSRIDLYVLTEILGPFTGGVLFFVFVFLLFQALRLAEFLITHKAFGLVLFDLIGSMILTFLPSTLPIAFLIGVMVGFGRLSADSELVAMKAGGLSIFRLTQPVILLALVVTALSLALGLDWAPRADRRQAEILTRIANRKIVKALQPGMFNSDFFNLLIFAEEKDPKTDRLKNVFIYDERDVNNPLIIVAREGEVISAFSSTEHGAAAVMRLFRGNIHRTGSKSEQYQKIDFGEYRVYLDTPGSNDGAKVKPRNMTMQMIQDRLVELKDHPKKKKRHERQERALLTELWRRLAVGFSPFIFGFLGVGFGTLRTRAVRASAALISFGLVLLYYFMLIACQDLGNRGTLPPIVASNLPNLFFVLMAWRSMKSAAW